MRYNRLIGVSGFALTLALAPLSAQAADIIETLKNSGHFSQLVDAIDKAGLTETLQGDGPYTVFAPNDEAFQTMQQDSQGRQQAGQSQQQSSQGQQQQTAQQQSAQSQQQGGQGQQTGQSQQDGQILQQVSSDQLKQILTHHIIEGKELTAQDVLGKQQKVETISGDQLTVDGTGTMVLLVPAGLTVSRVGDEVFVQRQVAAVAQPAVTVSTTGQQGQQQSGQQQGQQQATQSGQQSGQQSQQQAAAHSGQQGQQQSGQAGSQGEGQPMAEQQGLLRAAMVVEPGIQADNGVIHGIDQVLVPQKIEQQLMPGQGQSSGQQNQG